METGSLAAASERLEKALARLEKAVDARVSRDALVVPVAEEVQRMTADRVRLAGELDAALQRGLRLEEANHEVSKRLVTAMEEIRDAVAGN